MQENKIVKLSDIEHVLLRPNMYLGSIRPIEVYGYLYNTTISKFEYTKYSYIPSLIKCVNEVVDNAVDEYIRTNGKFSNKIDISIIDGVIKISDSGRGCPTALAEGTDISQLELAFTHAKAGSNFNDEDRETIGTNGLGAFLVNVFSQWFKVTSHTATQLGVLSCENNLSKHTCKVTNHPAVRTGTTVEFLPDYKRFGIETIDELHINLVHQRLIHLAVSFPDIQFTFNDKPLKFQKTEKYLDAFADTYCYFEDPNDKFVIAVTPNATDDFKQCSFVNGLGMVAGNHIDVINNEIISRLREHKVFKKYSITPGDIRNKIQLVVVMRKFPAMEFDSQSKERLTNAHSIIKQYFNTIDWDDLVKNIAKSEAIVDPILMSYRLKEELKNRLALKNMEKTDNKEVRCEKYYPSIGEKKYIMICEGDCLQKDELIFNVNENTNVAIKDINIGDLVLTHNQNVKSIVSKTVAIKDCVKIITKSGKIIKCSKNHRFYVYDTITKTFKFKRICNIDIKTDKLISNSLTDNFYFDPITIDKIIHEKYNLYIHGKQFETYCTNSHKFVVFEQSSSSFKLKEAQNINTSDDLMILLKNND